MYNDLREFLAVLRNKNELVEVTKEVDPKFEIGDICRKVNDIEGPALLFKNIKGYPGWSVAANVIGSLNRIALAMESTVDKMIADYADRLKDKEKFAAQIISKEGAPCKEVILKGKDIDVTKIPIPTWHPSDGGPFITIGSQITKDPDSGVPNASMLRQMVQKKDQIGINPQPGKHTQIHFFKKKNKGESLDFAVAIGLDPIISIVSCHNGPLNESEFDVAGALRQDPVKLVKCETVDIEVPATAELIIEGQILPETCPEGPFGEYTGWFAPATTHNPPVKVTCITHRKNPIFQGLYEGKPPTEDSAITTLTFSGSILATARENCAGLVAYAKNQYGAGYMMGVGAIKKMFPGHAKHAMHAIIGTEAGKYLKVLIIVDDSINVQDIREVIWAITTRCRPERDIQLEKDAPGSVLDPSMYPKSGICGRIMIDATEKWEEEGNAPFAQRQKVISHVDSPYWKDLSEKGLSKYLGVDLSKWERGR